MIQICCEKEGKINKSTSRLNCIEMLITRANRYSQIVYLRKNEEGTRERKKNKVPRCANELEIFGNLILVTNFPQNDVIMQII